MARARTKRPKSGTRLPMKLPASQQLGEGPLREVGRELDQSAEKPQRNLEEFE